MMMMMIGNFECRVIYEFILEWAEIISYFQNIHNSKTNSLWNPKEVLQLLSYNTIFGINQNFAQMFYRISCLKILTKLDDFYRSVFSDYCLHLYCYIQNVSAYMSSSLLQVFVKPRSQHRTSDHVLYLIHGDRLFWFRQPSSSSCRAASTDILDPLSPLLPIVHRLWQVFRATSRILP